METLKKSAEHQASILTFDNVYVTYHQQIKYFILQRVKNEAIADDLTQDTFLKVYVNIAEFNGKYQISTWIYNIAKNVVIDHYRKEKNKNKVDLVNAENVNFVDNTDQRVENNELTDQILQAFKILNKKEQQIAELLFFKELDYKEIAEKLLIPIGTVKGTINRIRAKLQEKLIYIYNID